MGVRASGPPGIRAMESSILGRDTEKIDPWVFGPLGLPEKGLCRVWH